jgi:hypothetical protein
MILFFFRLWLNSQATCLSFHWLRNGENRTGLGELAMRRRPGGNSRARIRFPMANGGGAKSWTRTRPRVENEPADTHFLEAPKWVECTPANETTFRKRYHDQVCDARSILLYLGAISSLIRTRSGPGGPRSRRTKVLTEQSMTSRTL